MRLNVDSFSSWKPFTDYLRLCSRNVHQVTFKMIKDCSCARDCSDAFSEWRNKKEKFRNYFFSFLESFTFLTNFSTYIYVFYIYIYILSYIIIYIQHYSIIYIYIYILSYIIIYIQHYSIIYIYILSYIIIYIQHYSIIYIYILSYIIIYIQHYSIIYIYIYILSYIIIYIQHYSIIYIYIYILSYIIIYIQHYSRHAINLNKKNNKLRFVERLIVINLLPQKNNRKNHNFLRKVIYQHFHFQKNIVTFHASDEIRKSLLEPKVVKQNLNVLLMNFVDPFVDAFVDDFFWWILLMSFFCYCIDDFR